MYKSSVISWSVESSAGRFFCRSAPRGKWPLLTMKDYSFWWNSTYWSLFLNFSLQPPTTTELPLTTSGKCITATSSKKWPSFSGQVQQYRGTELISFWKRQYYSPNTEVQRYKLLMSKMWPSIQPARSTEVYRYKEKYQNVQRSLHLPSTEGT